MHNVVPCRLQYHIRTNHSFDVRSFQSSQTEVPDLDQSRRAIDEDVVTLEVSVDDGRGARVQEMEASQDLPAPATDHLWLDGLQPPHVAVSR